MTGLLARTPAGLLLKADRAADPTIHALKDGGRWDMALCGTQITHMLAAHFRPYDPWACSACVEILTAREAGKGA